MKILKRLRTRSISPVPGTRASVPRAGLPIPSAAAAGVRTQPSNRASAHGLGPRPESFEGAVPEAGDAVPTTGDGVPTAADPVSGTARQGLNVFAIIGGLVLAGIGFYGSYRALVKLADAHHFGEFARVFPIGVDVGIVVLYALDLVLTHRRIRWPMLRLAAHGFTAATIIFNAASGGRTLGQDPVGVGMHAVIPVMFVMAVEAARRVIIQVTRAADVAAGTQRDSIPLERWLLAPVGSFLLFRRMVLHDVRSYHEAVDRRRDQLIYQANLDRNYPKGKQYPKGWKNAPMDARLPMIMESYGLTVDEALQIPQQAREEEERRAEAEAERQEAAKLDAELRAGDAEIRRLEKQAEVAEAQERLGARKSVATVASRSAYSKAAAVAEAQERVAVQEAEALESAVAADAAKRAAEDRLTAATADEKAAELEEQAAATRRTAAFADAEAAKTLAETRTTEARAAAAEKRAAEDQEDAVETARRAFGTAKQLAEEQRAEDARALEAATTRERAAEADKRAAVTREAAAETDRRAAGMEQQAAGDRRRAAVLDGEAAAAVRKQKEDLAAAETARLDAVGTRRRIAEMERAAVEAEHAARLKPTERDARRVARMILTDGAGDPDAVDLATIAAALGVSVSTASDRRKEAAELIARGYTLPRAQEGMPCLT